MCCLVYFMKLTFVIIGDVLQKQKKIIYIYIKMEKIK